METKVIRSRLIQSLLPITFNQVCRCTITNYFAVSIKSMWWVDSFSWRAKFCFLHFAVFPCALANDSVLTVFMFFDNFWIRQWRLYLLLCLCVYFVICAPVRVTTFVTSVSGVATINRNRNACCCFAQVGECDHMPCRPNQCWQMKYAEITLLQTDYRRRHDSRRQAEAAFL